MESFSSIFPRFNKENIAFSIDKFTGQSKYPINLWNEADSRGRNFYLRHSAEAQKQLQTIGELPAQLAGAKLSQQEASSQVASAQSKEDIFAQMLKINKDKVDQSSKHMSYDTIMRHMGKKGFAQ